MIKKYDFYDLSNIPNTSGIYMITNIINNKSYIGQSIHLRNRLKDHRRRSHYSGDREYNKTFYRSIRKYGIDLCRRCFREKAVELGFQKLD